MKTDLEQLQEYLNKEKKIKDEIKEMICESTNYGNTHTAILLLKVLNMFDEY